MRLSSRCRVSTTKKAVAFATVLVTTAGLAVAQQRTPYFRHMSSFSAQPGGPQLPSPWTPPANDEQLDFGKPGVASYTIRALVGEPVNLAIGTEGGSEPITWPAPPALPPGLRYANGVVSGTPTEAGRSSETITAKDSEGRTAQGRISFEIVDPTVVMSGVKPFVRVGAPLSGIVASNVANPHYSVRSLPGAQIGSVDADARAAFAGSVSAAGVFPLSIDVTRIGTSISATASLEVTAENPVAIAFDPPAIPALPGPVSVSAIPSYVVGTPTLSVASNVNAIRARGLTYQDGKLTGTLGFGYAADLTLKLKDSVDGSEATASIRIPEMLNDSSAIVIGPQMRQGTAPMAAQGSTTPAVVRTDVPIPRCTATQSIPGISIAADCTIHGTATSPGDHTLAVAIVPASNPQAAPVTASAPVKVQQAVALSSTSQPNIDLAPGESADISLSATGVIGTTSFELLGSSPAQLAQVGLSFNSATGAITGVPPAGTDVSFSVQATDSYDGAKASRGFRIKAAFPSLSANIPQLSLRTGDVRAYKATTNIPSPIFSIKDAPEYVRIDANTGFITVTAPETTGVFTLQGFGLRAASELRPTVTEEVLVANFGVVRPELKFHIDDRPSGRGNVALQVPFSFEGATTPGVRVTSGTLPPGLDILATSLSGKPTIQGSFPVTLTLRDSVDGRETSQPIVIAVGPALDIAFSQPGESSLGRGTAGAAISPIQANAVNALGTQTFSNHPVSGAMTTLASLDLAISPSGLITGTPAAPFSGPVNIRMAEVVSGVTNTVDRTLNLSIGQGSNASQSVPTVIGRIGAVNGVDATAMFYDGSATTAGYASYTAPLTYTFAQPTSINGLKVVSTYRQLIAVKNVDTGVTTNVTCTTPAPATCDLAIPASSSKVWEVRSSRYGNEGFTTDAHFSTAKLTYSGAAPTVASIASIPMVTAPINFTGQPLSVQPIATDAAGATFAVTGALPAGTALDPSTGAITGTPTEYGDFTANVTATNATGVPSVPAQIAIKVRSSEIANSEIPTLVGSNVIYPDGSPVPPDLIRAGWYDAPGASNSYYVNGGSNTITFSKPVTADRMIFQTQGDYATWNANIVITAVDTNTNVYSYQSGWAMRGTEATVAFPATTSRVWRVTIDRSIGVNTMKLAFGTTPTPRTPSFASALSTNKLTRNQSYAAINTVSAVDYGSIDQTGTFTATGLPPGMAVDSATGVVSGRPSTTGTFSYTLHLNAADGPAAPKGPYTVTVVSDVTVADVAPISFTGASVTTNGGVAYDNAYDASAATTLTIPGNGSIIVTYPQEVTLDGFKANYAYNGCNNSIHVRLPDQGNLVAFTSGLGAYGNLNDLAGSAATATSATRFEILNGTSCSLTLSTIALTKGRAYKYP